MSLVLISRARGSGSKMAQTKIVRKNAYIYYSESKG